MRRGSEFVGLWFGLRKVVCLMQVECLMLMPEGTVAAAVVIG